jgi:hypothetical protein
MFFAYFFRVLGAPLNALDLQGPQVLPGHTIEELEIGDPGPLVGDDDQSLARVIAAVIELLVNEDAFCI